MQAIVDDAPFGVATGLIGDSLDHVNRTLCDWLGCEPADLIGRNRDAVLERSSAQKLGAWLERLGIGETAGPIRLDLRHKTGATVPLDVHLRKKPHAPGSVRLFAYATRAGAALLPRRLPALEGGERAALEAGLADCRARLQRVAEHLEHARAEERQELAFILHDRVGQDLTAIALHLKALVGDPECDPVWASRVAEVRALADQAQVDLRALMLDLREPQRALTTLDGQLCRRAQELQARYGVPIHIAVPTGVVLADAAAQTIARIGSEAMLNAIKHSGCSRVVVRLSLLPRRFTLLVVDDGCGGVVLRSSQVTTLGLASMRARAQRIGARLRIRSPRGRGTAVWLALPTRES